MSRMGFMDKAKEIDLLIEKERARLKQEREASEEEIQKLKLGGLERAHTRRVEALALQQVKRLNSADHVTEPARELEELRAKQKRDYDIIIAETATRATGGVSSCTCVDEYMCRHNKSASYNTRKPTKDVIRLRQNAQRLRSSGREEEAEEMEARAVHLEAAAEEAWRAAVEVTVISSAWAGGKSRLEQLVEQQHRTAAMLEETHSEKLALLKQQQAIDRRNLLSTLAAERKKVIVYCRREALRRSVVDVVERHKERRHLSMHKSDGLKNVSQNMFGADGPDGRGDGGGTNGKGGPGGGGPSGGGGGSAAGGTDSSGWQAPQRAGLNNSSSIAGYDALKSGTFYDDMGASSVGAAAYNFDGTLKTTGSKAMDDAR
ncbi:unnamed protein product, partial [Phaeothamnion confervicola]